jgi:DNA-directed RNA polymerase specialized sigma24 family protein
MQIRADVTALLQAWSVGDQDVLDEPFALVHDELHRQAARRLLRERHVHTLRATALIHGVYLKLMGQREVEWKNRLHFLAIASTATRQILVELRSFSGLGNDEATEVLDVSTGTVRKNWNIAGTWPRSEISK